MNHSKKSLGSSNPVAKRSAICWYWPAAPSRLTTCSGGGSQQRVRPYGHRAQTIPHLLEGGVHPVLVEGPLSAFEDRVEVQLRGLGGVVGALSRDRVVEEHRVSETEHLATRGCPRHRSTSGRCDLAAEDALGVAQLPVAGSLVFPREERLEDLEGPSPVLLGSGYVGPAVHRSAGDPLEGHDPAGAVQGEPLEDGELPDARDQVEAHRRERASRLDAVTVGERQSALRSVIGAPLVPTFEDATQGALAGGPTTRSFSAAYRSRSSGVAAWITRFPPRSSNFSIQVGNLTRWSMEWPGRSRWPNHSTAGTPPLDQDLRHVFPLPLVACSPPSGEERTPLAVTSRPVCAPWVNRRGRTRRAARVSCHRWGSPDSAGTPVGDTRWCRAAAGGFHRHGRSPFRR